MLHRQITRALPSLSVRCTSTTAANPNDDIAPMLNNRNPRNLERLRIGYKPNGYALDKKGKKFWHKIQVFQNNRYVTASVVHFANGAVVEASSSEWAIKKQLFKPTDTAAFINIGRVLARRCIQAGITEARCDLDPKEGGKIALLLENLEKGGVSLQESRRMRKPCAWERFRPEKPWEVIEEIPK